MTYYSRDFERFFFCVVAQRSVSLCKHTTNKTNKNFRQSCTNGARLPAGNGEPDLGEYHHRSKMPRTDPASQADREVLLSIPINLGRQHEGAKSLILHAGEDPDQVALAFCVSNGGDHECAGQLAEALHARLERAFSADKQHILHTAPPVIDSRSGTTRHDLGSPSGFEQLERDGFAVFKGVASAYEVRTASHPLNACKRACRKT